MLYFTLSLSLSDALSISPSLSRTFSLSHAHSLKLALSQEYGLLARLECVCVPACVFLCASFCVGVRASVVFAYVYPGMCVSLPE